MSLNYRRRLTCEVQETLRDDQLLDRERRGIKALDELNDISAYLTPHSSIAHGAEKAYEIT